MEATWHRVSTTLLDSGNDREGTLSVFFDYDLGSWTFGFRFEHDPSWFDLVIECGPIRLSFTYWRLYGTPM